MPDNISLQKKVNRAHRRSYDSPISLSAGDHVTITKRDLWDGQHEWLWCIASTGREGWVPAAYLDSQNNKGLALRDYCAMELSVTEGEIVTILDEESGWYWCKNGAGMEGWVPVRCFD
jgi:hypothetical protein